MKFKFKYAEKIVYIFVVIGLAVFAILSILIMSQSDVFESKLYYKTVLDNAKGLQKKPTIMLSGFEIGRIDDFDFNPETNMIDVKFYVFEKYRNQVVEKSVISRTISPLNGEVTEFELIPPSITERTPMAQSSVIPYINSELGRKYIQEGIITQQGDDISSIINSINNILLGLQKKNNKEDGAIFHSLDNLVKITDKLSSIIETIDSEHVVENLNKSISKTNKLIEEMPNTLKLFNQNLQSMDSLLNNFNSPKKIADGVGGESLQNIIHQLDTTTFFIKESVKDLYDQKESIRLLLNSSQKTINRMNKTLQGINNNPLIRGGIGETNKINKVEIDD